MHAITITEPGGPEVLQWTQVPDPEPAAHEILIDVAATALNRADILQRQGFYPPPPGASPYPGLECSGTVVALGSDVTRWSIGDEVCALLIGGGYAERVAVHADHALAVPPNVGVIDATALPEVVATVWSNLAMLAHLRDGETLLVHGGTSGIGTMAIQIARSLGAQVVVTCGSNVKCDAALNLGATAAINYRDEDFVERIRELTDGRGADVILDVMGAKYLERNVQALAVNGRLVVIGLQGGTKGEIDLNTLLRKRAAVLATSLRARTDDEKSAIVSSVREHVWPLVEAGQLVPVIDRRLPINDVGQAQDLMLAGSIIGKIVLTMPASG